MQSNITAIGIATPPFMRTQDEIADLISVGFHLNVSETKILKKSISPQELRLDIVY